MKLTNTGQIPLSLAVWLAHDTYDHDSDPNVISATTLIKPIKAIVLGRQNKDLEQGGDVVSLVPSTMGTAYHDAIEHSWKNERFKVAMQNLGYPASVIDRIKVNPEPADITPDTIPVYMEKRGKRAVGNYIISGKFDFVAQGELEDFKSTSVWAYIFGSNTQKYIEQGSIYRWLHPEIITGDNIDIQFIFTDWTASKVVQDPAYPKKRIISQKLPLMSLPETDAFINQRVAMIDKLSGATQAQLPECTPEELWQKDSVWKYYKDPTKTTRSTKNYDNAAEAYAREAADGGVGLVKEVMGQVTHCKYCKVVEICDQAQELKKSGLLVM